MSVGPEVERRRLDRIEQRLRAVEDRHLTRIQALERTPNDDGCCCGDWIEPELLNGWANVGLPFSDIAYRLCENADGVVDKVEFRGRITGGTSGTVAWTFPEPPLPNDCEVITALVESGTKGVANVYFDMTSGDVTITFPVCC